MADAILIGLIALLNAGLGFSQNYRASRGIESLNRLAAPSAKVLRGGAAEPVDAGDLVPGDMVLLEEGSRVPADGRLLSSIDLSVDESALTGESVAVSKQSDPVAGNAAPLADRLCMAYSGTVVMRSQGRLPVTATGMRTEVGHIAREVQATGDEPTVFQREVRRLAAHIIHRRLHHFPVRSFGTYRFLSHHTPPCRHPQKGQSLPHSNFIHFPKLHQKCGRASFPGLPHLDKPERARALRSGSQRWRRPTRRSGGSSSSLAGVFVIPPS